MRLLGRASQQNLKTVDSRSVEPGPAPALASFNQKCDEHPVAVIEGRREQEEREATTVRERVEGSRGASQTQRPRRLGSPLQGYLRAPVDLRRAPPQQP